MAFYYTVKCTYEHIVQPYHKMQKGKEQQVMDAFVQAAKEHMATNHGTIADQIGVVQPASGAEHVPYNSICLN